MSDENYTSQEKLLDATSQHFAQQHILVVGDLMLDRYIWGEVSRVSPEAPVPVVSINRQTEGLGGAANVALNLVELGAQVSIAGCVGKDAAGATLQTILNEKHIDAAGVISVSCRPTTTKTRIVGGHQQMLRLDEECIKAIDEVFETQLIHQIDAISKRKLTGIILSDYAKGVLSKRVCQHVIALAHQLRIPVAVDPKGREFIKYQGATFISPNLRELAEASSVPVTNNSALLLQGQNFVKLLKLDFLALTQGKDGIALLRGPDKSIQHCAAKAKEVFDVSGAGDTVIAVLMAGLLAGLDPRHCIELANVAAGIVVGKVGTVPILRAELLKALSKRTAATHTEDKICSLAAAQVQIQKWRKQGERIVFTNGCFDILHAGHVDYLQQARKEGDYLIIGLNTDASIARLKGPTRPVVPEKQRAKILASLASVDQVIFFEEDTPLALIQAISPDVLCKGADYAEADIVGADFVKAQGGRVLRIDLVDGVSTTAILDKAATIDERKQLA